jgi:hypothetical protein
MGEQATGLLTLVCAKTGGEINTGAVYSCADLDRVRDAKLMLHCRFCGETHLFRFAEARLKPIDGGKSP